MKTTKMTGRSLLQRHRSYVGGAIRRFGDVPLKWPRQFPASPFT